MMMMIEKWVREENDTVLNVDNHLGVVLMSFG